MKAMVNPTYLEPDEDAVAIPLAGGDVTEGVVRIGDTVRRPLGFNDQLVHVLLKHFESAGFTGAPWLLGIDAEGREVLTFMDGEVAGRPRPDWIADEERLVSVSKLVRACDDAAADLVLPDDVKPFNGGGTPSGLPSTFELPVQTVGHLDITPDNVVFRDGVAVALIDFDLARPTFRLDEVHNLMLHWAPLCDPVDADPPLRGVDVPRRCRIVADAYGLSEQDRARLIELATVRAERSWFSMRHLAETRGGGWARMWEEGIGDQIKRRQAWLDRNADAIDAAVNG